MSFWDLNNERLGFRGGNMLVNHPGSALRK